MLGHVSDLDSFGDAQGARRVLRPQRHLPGGECAEKDDVSGQVESFDAHAWFRGCREERTEPQQAVCGPGCPRGKPWLFVGAGEPEAQLEHVFEHVYDLKGQPGNGAGDQNALLQGSSSDDALENDSSGDGAAECQQEAGRGGRKWRLINHGGGSLIGGVVLNRTGGADFEGSFDSLARGMRTRVR